MKLTQEDIAELEAVFHIFTGGRSSGTIGRTELDLAMNYLGIDVDEAQLKRIFDKLDKDRACYSPLSPSCLFQPKLLYFVAGRSLKESRNTKPVGLKATKSSSLS